MIFRFEKMYRSIRRWLSRSERAIGLLRLPESAKTATEPGIVMIQVDGLSHSQLNQAFREKKMPFLYNLLRNERYRVHLHYSGLPSSTPAMQGELFYGVRGGVPAFSFKEKKSGEIVCMYEPGPTASIEQKMEKKGTPLLQEGSVYSSIFSGGAREAHFCPSALGWGDLFSKVPPFAFFFFFFRICTALSGWAFCSLLSSFLL